MDREQYAILYQVERSHWWYRGMRRNALALLDRYLAPGRSYAILDAGCGTGGTTMDLLRFGSVTGLDMSADALDYATSRGLKRLLRGSVERLPFRTASFDALTCFDVLYHRAVGQEARSLGEAHRVLRPGGVALFREPAFDWLRGAHDVGIHTQRRFTLDGFAGFVEGAGFKIERATYGNMLLFPLALLKRTLDRFLPGAPTDLSVPPAPLNFFLETMLALEGPVLDRARLPFGLSVIVVARA